MSEIQITALMTTYNCDQYVEETIDSILTQSYPYFKFLIIDDGSTDQTCKILSRLKDPRIIFHQYKENLGVGYRLNEALSLIKTPYIAKVDGDDISTPDRFEKQLDYLEKHPELDIIKCYIEYFSNDKEIIESNRYHNFVNIRTHEHNKVRTPKQIAAMTERWSCVIHSSIFARSDVIKLLGYPTCRVGEDYNLIYRAIVSGYQIGCIPEKLLRVRLSQNSTTMMSHSANNFAEMLINLKREKITLIVKNHGAIWIYGSGGLALSFAEQVIKNGYPFAGFLNKDRSSITFLDKEYEIAKLTADSARGVIIAAQPVRSEIMNKLIDYGWKEWLDFMVLA